MSQARLIFEDLRKLSSSPNPDANLLDYCRTTLDDLEAFSHDFKESSFDGGNKLPMDDKRNLAKAISGFANGDGGVLVWGIRDRKHSSDGKTDLAKVSYAKDFLEKLLDLSGKATIPSVQGIEGFVVSSTDTDKSGIVVVFIPASDLPPHRVALDVGSKEKGHYFIRTSTDFEPATHSMLEDMFGRRPKPKLSLRYEARSGPQNRGEKIVYELVVLIVNNGRGLARFPYLELTCKEPHGVSDFGVDGNGNTGLKSLDYGPSGIHDRRRQRAKFGAADDVVIHSGMAHPVTIVQLCFERQSNSSEHKLEDVAIKYAVAAEGVPIINDSVTITKSDLESWFEQP